MNKIAKILQDHIEGKETEASKKIMSKVHSQLKEAGFKPPFEIKTAQYSPAMRIKDQFHTWLQDSTGNKTIHFSEWESNEIDRIIDKFLRREKKLIIELITDGKDPRNANPLLRRFSDEELEPILEKALSISVYDDDLPENKLFPYLREYVTG